MSELLEPTIEKNSHLESLILPKSTNSKVPAADFFTVAPKPGFVVKIRKDGNEKVFINICTSDSIPCPREISDAEILKLLESDDMTGFRVPMSLGEPHVELDHGGKGCSVYDVLINLLFYDSIHKREILMGFFLSIVIEGIEAKYNINLTRDWTRLKNRKCMGTISEHHIRKQSKPLITEIEDSHRRSSPIEGETPKLKGEVPAYILLQEPVEGHPDYLTAEIYLPKIMMASSLVLDVGEDRILLQTRSNVYHMDVYLPYYLDVESCVAQFNRKTKVLGLTLPVQPKC